jgi:hypothetical protein
VFRVILAINDCYLPKQSHLTRAVDTDCDTGTGLSPSTSVFPLSVPFHQCSILIFIYAPEDKWAKPWNLPKNNAISEIGEYWIETNLLCFRFQGRAMAQSASRRPLTEETRSQSQVSPCEICAWKFGTGTGSSPRTSIFPCQCNSAIAPYRSWSTCCFYQKGQRARPWKLTKSSAFRKSGRVG